MQIRQEGIYADLKARTGWPRALKVWQAVGNITLVLTTQKVTEEMMLMVIWLIWMLFKVEPVSECNSNCCAAWASVFLSFSIKIQVTHNIIAFMNYPSWLMMQRWAGWPKVWPSCHLQMKKEPHFVAYNKSLIAINVFNS